MEPSYKNLRFGDDKASWRLYARKLARDNSGDALSVGSLISAQLTDWSPWVDSRGLLVYRWLPGEPDLQGLYEKATDKKLYLPTQALPAGIYPLDEGCQGTVSDLRSCELDLALVPGLMFDRAGYRLGRGGGYYDRLLRKLNPNVITVGVAHSRALVEQLPRDPWDMPVDYLVSELAVIRCSHV